MLTDYLLLLAQDQGGPDGMMRLLFPLLAISFLFYFMLIRPQKKKEEEFRKMVENLKENDRVVTVGGIHGVVTNVRRDNDMITLRIDEANGTKIRVSSSAIARVVVDDAGENMGKADGKTTNTG